MRGEYYYDDGEEWSDEDGRAEYLFFIHNVPEAELLEVVGTIARRPDVPDGVYVTINDEHGNMGEGRQVDLGL